MTIKELLSLCENVDIYTEVLLYDSLEDYKTNSPNWKTYTADQLYNSSANIATFKLHKYFIAIALA